MFGKWFGKKKPTSGNGQADAIAALFKLDAAIKTVHPDRFHDELDAGLVIQPLLVSVNTMLGRSGEDRFNAITYEEVFKRVGFFTARGLLADIQKASQSDVVISALIDGTLHQLRLVMNERAPDKVNLGAEVQSSTRTLIDFLNRGSR